MSGKVGVSLLPVSTAWLSDGRDRCSYGPDIPSEGCNRVVTQEILDTACPVWFNGFMSKNHTNTTTTDLTDYEVLEIASELGLERIFEFTNADRSRYTVQGYEIKINHWALNKNTYTISMDGEVLRRGGGDVVDAMRDFITAVS